MSLACVNEIFINNLDVLQKNLLPETEKEYITRHSKLYSIEMHDILMIKN